MSGITLNTTFSNPNLPKTISHKKQILDIPSLLGWFQGDKRHCSFQDSAIGRFEDIASKGLQFKLQVNGAKLVEGDVISGFSAAEFDDEGDIYKLGGQFDTASAFTMAALFKPTVGSGDQAILSNFTGPGSRVVLGTDKNSDCTYMYDSKTLKFPFDESEWVWLILSFDGVDTIKGYSSDDGGVQSAVVAGPTSSSAAFYLGALAASGSQAFVGHVSDVLLFNSDIITSGESEKVKNYFRDVYSV